MLLGIPTSTEPAGISTPCPLSPPSVVEQSGHQKLMLCFFFPLLFALPLEQVLHGWEQTGDCPLKQAAKGGYGVSILGGIQILTRGGPEQPALAAPALSRGAGLG